MDEIKNMLLTMQQDIKQQKRDMIDMKEDIISSIINNLNEKFNNLELKNELLEKNMEIQNKKISFLDRQSRRKNLVLFGVEEREKSYHELEEMIINIINTDLKISCGYNNIEAVRRLGKKGEKVRPVVLTLNTVGFKLNIQKNKKYLKNTSYYIKDDYPLEVLNKRKELQTQLQKEKNAGNTAFLKYDKLIVKNNKHSPRSQPNKRNLSESPEISQPINRNDYQDSKQPLKKKQANMQHFVIQKPKQIPPQTEASQSTTKTPQHNTA